jgi:poly(3-hydroxybutyrate) depolymerase
MSGRFDAVTAPSGFDTEVLVASGDRIDAKATSQISSDAYGQEANLAADTRPNTSAAYLSDFQIVGADDKASSMAVLGTKPLSAKLEATVDAIEEAANGGLTGAGTDEFSLWNAIAPLNKEEFAQVNERFAEKYGKAYASFGKKWDIREELIDELSKEDLSRFEKMIADKSVNDVPAQFRANGESLLKPDSNLVVGGMNRVTLADGRDYDVYIPRNADSRAPVMVAMPGAGLGDMKGVMAVETGLTIEAEKTGSIIVFANPKARVLDGSMGMASATWNMPGRTNIPSQLDTSFNDRDYLDNVLQDLSTRTQMAEKVGMIGFSDGARAAEVYAADRPDKVAGVVALSGTWMKGDAAPSKAMPTMIVHGDKDGILPYDGGFGSTSDKVVVATNLDRSQPNLQAKVWSQAAGGEGNIVERVVDGDVEKRTYDAKGAPVVEYIIKGADHGVHDYKNNGSRFWQWVLGKPEMKHDFVTKGAGFLKDHIVRNLAEKPRN